MAKKSSTPKTVESLRHAEARRRNIPTAEHESVMDAAQRRPKALRYPRNTDLDPQLVWRGKDEQDWSDLVVPAPPLFIQEKVAPKTLIDDLLRQSNADRLAREVVERAEKGLLGPQIDLFADFNGIPAGADRTDFYQHEQNWTNRMILGDSLQVMASLAEREGLRGRVQCIYLDPPYGIKFNSNFQWSTTSRDVKDGNAGHITREPEQVKAFRDTWRDGIHSYLTYLRDRFTVARDLLAESGSIFVQIGDENVHRVRAVMDEVFGEDNFVSLIAFRKTGTTSASLLDANNDFLVWYAKHLPVVKFRPLFKSKVAGGEGATEYKTIKLFDLSERSATSEEVAGTIPLPAGSRLFTLTSVVSDGAASSPQPLDLFGKTYLPSKNEHWKTTVEGMYRLHRADRLSPTTAKRMYRRYFDDYAVFSSPHRMLGVDENGDLIDPAKARGAGADAGQSFTRMILENLKAAGVQQVHKADRINFTALAPWPGEMVCAEGRYLEGDPSTGSGQAKEKRAAVFIGPEFGTVQRADLVAAAREAGDAGFDVVIACAFNYEAHAGEFSKLGRVPVLKARMNADLHMAEDLKNTGKGNLFVIFGEPDIAVLEGPGDAIRVKVNGVDVFDPGTGEVRSDGADGIACWFIDTDYNEESFFVRQAYFLGANDPYGALRTTLKAEINAEAWGTLNGDTSRPFPRPASGRIAVKVINHLGDEVMKVFKV